MRDEIDNMMREMLPTIGYYAAALIAVTLPPAFLYWFLIHPFTAFWRRLGKATSFTIVSIICIGVAVALWQVKGILLAGHLGYHWPLMLLGTGLYVLGIIGERSIRRHLSFRTLVGAPELDAASPGELLTEGPYARCRNPRYVNIVVSTLGIAMILNYPVLYVEVVVALPAIYLLVLLEEKELDRRFGAAYEAYRRAVPRFLPDKGWIF